MTDIKVIHFEHMGVKMTSGADESETGPTVFHGLNFMQRPKKNEKGEKAD